MATECYWLLPVTATNDELMVEWLMNLMHKNGDTLLSIGNSTQWLAQGVMLQEKSGTWFFHTPEV